VKAWLGLGVCVLCVAGCSDGHCTLAGCDSGAKITLDSNESQAELLASSLHSCLNTVCIDGVFGTETDAGVNIHFRQTAGPVPYVDSGPAAWVAVMNPDTTIRVYWIAGSQPVQDGDHYTVEIRGPDGQLRASVDRSATYTTVYPNGEDCGPKCMEFNVP
jgi:hypothetical protein